MRLAKRISVTYIYRLYLQNLPEKLHKQDLRRQLYCLFSTYGSVLDINAAKTSKMRGQAFITFKDIQTAAQASRNLDGFEFFGRPIVSVINLLFSAVVYRKQKISYAKSKSDFVAKLDGTYKIPVTAEAAQRAADAGGDKGTALQQSVFSGVPPSTTAGASGQKRVRDDDEQSDAPMDEDEEDMEMDESDDD